MAEVTELDSALAHLTQTVDRLERVAQSALVQKQGMTGRIEELGSLLEDVTGRVDRAIATVKSA